MEKKNVVKKKALLAMFNYGLLNPLAHIPEVQSALLNAGAELKRALK